MINITSGDTEQPAAQPVEINITSVEGATAHRSDFSLITASVGAVLVVTGTVDTPDKVFSLPLKWRGDWLLFAATVTNGAFETRIKFQESGVAVLDDECVNKDLPYKMFSVRPVQVDVVATV